MRLIRTAPPHELGEYQANEVSRVAYACHSPPSVGQRRLIPDKWINCKNHARGGVVSYKQKHVVYVILHTVNTCWGYLLMRRVQVMHGVGKRDFGHPEDKPKVTLSRCKSK